MKYELSVYKGNGVPENTIDEDLLAILDVARRKLENDGEVDAVTIRKVEA